ncbi:MAG: HD domain-containing protein [Anaerolineae bacterium]|nr:HD domain-containing protein [Anaerolineae bacterium]
MAATLYRLRQGVRALFAFAQPVDDALAGRFLSPALLKHFQALRRSEQLHSLRVLRALLTEGEVSPGLTVAALLHDVGKSRYPMSLWQRTLPVLVKRFFPQSFAQMSAGDPAKRWQRGFVVYVHHPAWSADIIAEGGGDADAAWLAAHHADDPQHWREHPLYDQLCRLQAADNME